MDNFDGPNSEALWEEIPGDIDIEPCARKIFDTNTENKITINLDILKNILNRDEIKDKYVCCVSIAGTFRQGKSFFLSLLLRYLDVRYKKKKDIKDWLHSRDGIIHGFPWRAGSEPYTTGIQMWSEIFLATLPSGEEAAIILLDTEGAFDNSKGITECATVFAMSTLISSFQIYNLKDGIKLYDLTHLKHFSGYGQLLVGDGDSDRHPFQQLMFLIRDWASPFEFSYGNVGGKAYLRKQLNTTGTDESSEPSMLKKNVKDLFENITCYLLPHPGSTVASSPHFQGSLESIDAEFLKQVQILAPLILSPETLSLKTINGMRIKVADWLKLLESYATQFQSLEMPDLTSIFEAAAGVYYNTLLEECIEEYDKSMSFLKNREVKSVADNVLETEQAKSRDRAVDVFTNKKKMGDANTKEKYKERLINLLEEKFLECKELNDLKRENEKKLEEEQRRRKEEEFKHQEQLKYEKKLCQEKEREAAERLEEQAKRHEEQLKREDEIRRQEEQKHERLLQDQRHQHKEMLKKERKQKELNEMKHRDALRRERCKENGGPSNMGNIIRLVGKGVAENKIIAPVAALVDVSLTGIAISRDVKHKTSRNTVEQVAAVAGGWGGAAGGAVGGAALGTAIFPGVGTVIGGVVGGIVGSVTGSATASGITEVIGDATGYGIEAKRCKICNKPFEVRKYKGEDVFELCEICVRKVDTHYM